MFRTFSLSAGWLAGVGVLLTLVGCHQLNPGGMAEKTSPHPEQLPAASPSNIEADFENAAAALTTLPPPPDSAGEYRALTDRECQCLAARAATSANLLDMEAEAIARQDTHPNLSLPRSQRKEDLQRAFLTDQALSIRNKSAEEALELYFHLAEAEARKNLLQTSLEVTGTALTRTRGMEAKGLKLPVDSETFHRQQLELEDQQTQDLLAIRQLNTELIRLLGFPSCPDWQIWPTANLAVCPDPIDVQAAVALGLALRP
ncbi:MAG: hypothetical protein JO112_23915, partial [Planctomycetes bacterium]|nr:hypothetical protein [Planctomycetota bacterium]